VPQPRCLDKVVIDSIMLEKIQVAGKLPFELELIASLVPHCLCTYIAIMLAQVMSEDADPNFVKVRIPVPN